MSPMLTTGAGLSVFPLGLTRGASGYYFVGFWSSNVGWGNGVAVSSDGSNIFVGYGFTSSTNPSYYSITSQGIVNFGRNANTGNSPITGDKAVAGLINDSSSSLYYGSYRSSIEFAIVKVNSSNTIQWQPYAASLNPWCRIANAASGFIYAGLRYGQSSGSNVSGVAKFNASNGSIVWQRQINGTGNSWNSFPGIALDSSENVYICFTAATSPYSSAIAKWNSSGTIQWQRTFNVGANTFSCSNNGSEQTIAVDASGNVYALAVSGSASSMTTYVTKLNTSGTQQWQRKLTGANGVWGQAIVVDGSGSSYVLATSQSDNLAYLVKYDTNGNIQWQQSITDSTGNVSVYGQGSPSMSIGSNFVSFPVLSGGTSAIFKLPLANVLAGAYSISGRTITISASAGLTDAAGGFSYGAGSLTESSNNTTWQSGANQSVSSVATTLTTRRL